MTDLECPNCGEVIVKEEKLQYMFLYKDFSEVRKHLKNEILQEVLKKQAKTDSAGKPLNIGAVVQNCHVPTPADGFTSNEWISSTVIKPLSMARTKEIKKN